MADIPFSIGGNDIRCPDFDQSDFSQLGDIEYEYLDGSPVYLGFPSITYFWPYLTGEEVATLRTLYDGLVAGSATTNPTGTPISLTVPDYANGGLRLTTAYMMELSGAAGGDGSKGFKAIFVSVSRGAFQDAFNTPVGNLWSAGDRGQNVIIGQSNDQDTGWQFS